MSTITIFDNLTPGDIITMDWSWGLIITSYLISVLGSYTYFQILGQMALSKGRYVKQFYLILSSISLGGCAVWSMHFIGMMACTFVGTPVSFNVGLTVLSGLISVVSCRVGLMLLTMSFPTWFVTYIGDQDHPLLINLPTPNHKKESNTYNSNISGNINIVNRFDKDGFSSPIYFNRNFLVKPYFKDNTNFHLEREPITPEISPPDSPSYIETNPIFYNQSYLNPANHQSHIQENHVIPQNSQNQSSSISSNTNPYYIGSNTVHNNQQPQQPQPQQPQSHHQHQHQHHHSLHNNPHHQHLYNFNRSASCSEFNQLNNSNNNLNSSNNSSSINNSELHRSVSTSSFGINTVGNDSFPSVSSPKSYKGFELEIEDLERAKPPKKNKTLWAKFKKYVFHNGFITSTIWYNNRNTLFRLVSGSFLLAIGIFGMHYTGMAAMELNGIASYDSWLILVSFVIAWIASFAALYITAFSNTHLQHLLSSVVMGLGICGMHYTAMHSITYTYFDMGYTNNDNSVYMALNISLMSLLVCFFFIVLTSIVNKRVRDKLSKLTSELKREKIKSDILINSILPSAISNKMKQGEIYVAEECSGISIIFADIVNFTKMTSNYSPKNLVLMLNRLYSLFDDLTESMNLEKIKTIGDSYMVVSGLPWHNCDDVNEILSPDIVESNNYKEQRMVYNANKAIMFANNLLDVVEMVNLKYGYDIHLRIGINTGDAIAGVIGKKRFSFDLWGDAVNVASRMESSGYPDKICVSENTFNLLSRKYIFEKQSITVKGKGDMGLYVLNRESTFGKGSSETSNIFGGNNDIVIPILRETNYIDDLPQSFLRKSDEGGRGNS